MSVKAGIFATGARLVRTSTRKGATLRGKDTILGCSVAARGCLHANSPALDKTRAAARRTCGVARSGSLSEKRGSRKGGPAFINLFHGHFLRLPCAMRGIDPMFMVLTEVR